MSMNQTEEAREKGKKTMNSWLKNSDQNLVPQKIGD